jgi:hypothetical protein
MAAPPLPALAAFQPRSGLCRAGCDHFAAWLDGEHYTAAPCAHLRYCCRDDYGSEPEVVSPGRASTISPARGWAAGEDADRELTWPEGNARLAG